MVVNPAGHYLTNVLLHAASSVLLFLVLLRMTRELWPSAWVAAVFAIHPLHVESVAWLAERRDVLSGLFFMLTLGAYTLYAERPSLARYLAVAGLFCSRADVQADARHGSLPAAIARLLAARSVSAGGRTSKGRVGLVVRSFAGRLAVGGGKDPAHRPWLATSGDRPVHPLECPLDQSRRAIVALHPPGQCRGGVRPLLGPVLLSRSTWLPFILILAPSCRWSWLSEHWFCW